MELKKQVVKEHTAIPHINCIIFKINVLIKQIEINKRFLKEMEQNGKIFDLVIIENNINSDEETVEKLEFELDSFINNM